MGRHLVAAFLLAVCGAAIASAAVDQSVTVSWDDSLSAHLVDQTFSWAQTFTAGQTGQLSSIELQIWRYPNALKDLVVDIRETSEGRPVEPDAPVLGSVHLPRETVPLEPATFATPAFVPIDLSAANVQVSVGQVLAIALRSDEPDVPFERGYLWAATNQGVDPYHAGGSFERFEGQSMWLPLFDAAAQDQGFKTIVVPEPCAMIIFVAGILCAKQRPERRRKSSVHAEVNQSGDFAP
jgi:hypothetical protein